LIGSAAVIVAGGILAFISFYISFKLRDNNNNDDSGEQKSAPTHQWFQIGLLVIGFFALLIMAKGVLDLNTNCETVLASFSEQKVYVYGNNFTSPSYHWDDYMGASEAPSQSDREAFLFHTNTTINNTYEEVCFNNQNNTNRQFYTMTLWFFSASLIYILFHVLWVGLQFARQKLLERKQSRGRG